MGQKEKQLLDDFFHLTQDEKFEKVMIYLHAMQKSDFEFVGLYSLVEELGSNGIEEKLLSELYSILVGIVYGANDILIQKLSEIQEKLFALRQREEVQKKSEEKDLLEIEKFF